MSQWSWSAGEVVPRTRRRVTERWYVHSHITPPPRRASPPMVALLALPLLCVGSYPYRDRMTRVERVITWLAV